MHARSILFFGCLIKDVVLIIYLSASCLQHDHAKPIVLEASLVTEAWLLSHIRHLLGNCYNVDYLETTLVLIHFSFATTSCCELPNTDTSISTSGYKSCFVNKCQLGDPFIVGSCHSDRYNRIPRKVPQYNAHVQRARCQFGAAGAPREALHARGVIHHVAMLHLLRGSLPHKHLPVCVPRGQHGLVVAVAHARQGAAVFVQR
mmetsp:Transcript_12938/g.24644  ORF Transcript_12938/g.24644 Transcript_12938/m.24644 type:complete len:203 (-) Transcript_12938:1570-2178(-)